MKLTIGGKDYTICYTVAATLCDDLLETITSIVGATSNGDDAAQSIVLAGRLPALTKSLMYGGLLQMHGMFGDGSVRNKDDAEKLLYQYMMENAEKDDGKLANIFNALYTQMGEDNFLSRIGLTENQNEKVTPIKSGKRGGGEN